MNLIISFSARKNGNSDEIAKYIAKETDEIVFFRELNYHNCRNCDYECFSDFCKYHDDDIYDLYQRMSNYQKVILIVPMYCQNPSSLYFAFNERCQDYFMHNEKKYYDIAKRLFIIGIYGEKEQNPDFIPCLEKWFNDSEYTNHVLGIERHKYNLKLKDTILDVEEIRNLIKKFIHPTDAKIEKSAMAVVICQGKILTTKEMIYEEAKLSLPKGHIEKNETPIEASIRECYEETNIEITEANLVKELTPYGYEFLMPSNSLIRKTLLPYLFEIKDFGSPIPKEERMISVEWMSVSDFMQSCSYENVKTVVTEALEAIYKSTRLSAYNGDRNAQYNLACLHEDGICAPRDMEQAIFWYRKAALQDHELAIQKCKELGVDLNAPTIDREVIRKALECRIYPLGYLERYKYTVICTSYDGKWILSRHKKRNTWETQGGHIEDGETPLECAKRELFEESGIKDADIYPVCDYWGFNSQACSNGMVFLSVVHSLGELPESEMKEIKIFDTLPAELTYPQTSPKLYAEAEKLLEVIA